MAFSVIGNDGVLYTIGDLNQVKSSTGAIYWSQKSTPINIHHIRYDIMNSYSAPTLGFTDENRLKVKALDEETINGLNSQYYWLIGDCQRGGICFARDGNTIYLHRVCDPQRFQEEWDKTNAMRIDCNTPSGTEDCMLYLMHKFIRNGSEQTTGFGFYYLNTPSTGFGLMNYGGSPLAPLPYVDNEASMTTYSGNEFPPIVENRKYPYLLSDNAGGTVTFINWWDGLMTEKPDPNSGGGSGGSSGGDGEFDYTSDDVPFPNLPPDMLLDSGIIRMYIPNKTQLKDFIDFIYSAPNDFIENFKKIWVNPMDSIISFGVVPFDVTAPYSEVVSFCGVPLSNDGHEIVMNYRTSQYMIIDCGSKPISKFWDNALDQNNYTQVKLYLPFIGYVSIDADEIIGGTATIKYYVDLLTGDCMAFVRMDKQDISDINFGGVMYAFKGNILSQAPLTGNNYAQLYSGVINTVSAIANPTPQSIAGIGKEILGQKVDVQRSSTISANSGHLGIYRPYFILERPVQSLANTFKSTEGYPYNQTEKLENLSGYTEINDDTFRIDDINDILDEEVDELLNLMNGGIII